MTKIGDPYRQFRKIFYKEPNYFGIHKTGKTLKEAV